MGERTSYEPGTFCWVDLATSDAEGAKAFYTGLLGWDLEDMPADEAGVYTMASVNGRHVAALYPQPSDQADRGAPPNWMNYVLVEDVDESANRATELGANVLAPPFDVAESGRQVVIADPQGAIFSLWQAKQHFGAGLVNDPGALSFNVLSTTDLEAANSFYADLLGWRSESVGGGPEEFFTVHVGENMNGGIREMPAEDPRPPHWLAYFTTSDLEASIAKTSELGGVLVAGPMPGGPGNIAVAQDPQGAYFALYEGEVDP